MPSPSEGHAGISEGAASIRSAYVYATRCSIVERQLVPFAPYRGPSLRCARALGPHAAAPVSAGRRASRQLQRGQQLLLQPGLRLRVRTPQGRCQARGSPQIPAYLPQADTVLASAPATAAHALRLPKPSSSDSLAALRRRLRAAAARRSHAAPGVRPRRAAAGGAAACVRAPAPRTQRRSGSELRTRAAGALARSSPHPVSTARTSHPGRAVARRAAQRRCRAAVAWRCGGCTGCRGGRRRDRLCRGRGRGPGGERRDARLRRGC